MGSKGSFWNIKSMYSYLMISNSQVQFSEIGCPIQIIQHIVHHRNGKSVFEDGYVQCPIIYAKSPSAIFLFYQLQTLYFVLLAYVLLRVRLILYNNSLVTHWAPPQAHFCTLGPFRCTQPIRYNPRSLDTFLITLHHLGTF